MKKLGAQALLSDPSKQMAEEKLLIVFDHYFSANSHIFPPLGLIFMMAGQGAIKKRQDMGE